MADSTEIVRGAYAAFAEGDIPGVLSILDPKVSWTETEGFPYGGTYEGPQAVLEGVFMKLGTEWEGWAAIPREFVTQGDTVIAMGEYSGKYKATGRSFKAPFAHVWKLENGKVVSFFQYTDTVIVQRALA